MSEQHPQPAPAPDPLARFRHLPEPIPFDQFVEVQPSSGPPEPDMGRDPEHDWLLRG
jgi:hypothetical protein